jgi:HEPN domain-containing protein
MKASTRQWLELAEADLKSCENNLQDESLSSIIAFHSQQAVEKAFKALLEENGRPVPKVHNLTRLHSLSEPFLQENISLSELDLLDDVYVSSRYPIDFGITPLGKPTLAESKELYEIARKIYIRLYNTIGNYQ